MAMTVPYSYDSWIVYGELFLAGFFNFAAQTLHMTANQRANPATVVLISYVGVAYTFLSDLLFFEFNLTVMQLSGVMICLTCSVSVVIYKMHLPKEESQQQIDNDFDDEFKK